MHKFTFYGLSLILANHNASALKNLILTSFCANLISWPDLFHVGGSLNAKGSDSNGLFVLSE